MQFDTRSLWIYLHFPHLQLNLIESAYVEQELGLKPRAVVDTANNRICQINEQAAQLGIKHDMGLASASLLCAELHLHEYQAEIESQHIENIAKYLYLFTSDIVLLPPHALALRAQNMLELYGGLTGYWPVIVQALLKMKIEYVAASAYSIQGAKLLALNKVSLISEHRQNIESALAKCRLAYSDIDQKDLHKLSRIGICTYADLLALPMSDIANRVSRFSMGIINELLGKQAAKVTFYHPQASYNDYLELLYEISLSDKLLPVINISLSKLASFLLLRNAHCLQIKIRFYQREHEAQEYIFSSIRPIYKCQDWTDIIALKLESIKFESPVYAIALSCEKYELAEVSNDDMFAQKSTHVAALTLLSRLQSKLGEQQVKQVNFVADCRPEYSSQHSKLQQASSKNDYSHALVSDRPGLLLPTPEPLHLKVEIIKGPERIQTGWWDDHIVNRDYFVGQSQDGQQVWIFKTPNKEWYLHGFFI